MQTFVKPPCIDVKELVSEHNVRDGKIDHGERYDKRVENSKDEYNVNCNQVIGKPVLRTSTSVSMRNVYGAQSRT